MQEQSRKARALLREQDLLPFPGEHDLANILRYVVTCSIGKILKEKSVNSARYHFLLAILAQKMSLHEIFLFAELQAQRDLRPRAGVGASVPGAGSGVNS